MLPCSSLVVNLGRARATDHAEANPSSGGGGGLQPERQAEWAESPPPEDMTTSRHAKRLILIAAATTAAVGAFAGSASGRPEGVTFVAGNSRVVQGNEATLTVRVSPATARCSLAVRYKSGAKQSGLPSVRASSGIASWT